MDLPDENNNQNNNKLEVELEVKHEENHENKTVDNKEDHNVETINKKENERERRELDDLTRQLEENGRNNVNDELNEGVMNVVIATYYSVTIVAIFSLLGILINLAFAIALTVTWSDNHVDLTFCPKNVFKWSQGLYIMLYISFGFEVIYLILYCYSDPDNRPKAFSQIKNCLVGIPHFVFLIGSMVVYFKMEVPEVCGSLHQSLLAYIITFWVFYGLNCLVACGLICYFACLAIKAEK